MELEWLRSRPFATEDDAYAFAAALGKEWTIDNVEQCDAHPEVASVAWEVVYASTEALAAWHAEADR